MTKISINKKATWFVIIAIGIMAICLLIAGFISVWEMRFNTIGQSQKQDAEMFSNFIAEQIEGEFINIKVYLSSPWWHDAVKEANLRYVNWEPKAIEEYMARMDEQWFSSATNTQFIKEWLSSRMSQRLKVLAEQSRVVAEIFLTDKYGGLVAASNKTSDFYQADEIWWQRAYNNGKGDIFLGGIELDQSSKKISIAMAVPLKDGAGQVIGVSKTVLDIAIFFQPLIEYRFGKTGYVALYNEHGEVVNHPWLDPMSKAGLSSFELDRLSKNKNGFEIITANCLKAESLVAATKIKSSFLEKNGINWIVVVAQDQKEVFLPLYKIISAGFILTLIISFLIIIVMRSIMHGIFISPLQKIQDGAQHFFDGDLDYRIDIKTADEFELLAISLNGMSAHLKQTMVSRDNLALEIEQRKQIARQLEESELKFRVLYSSSADAIMILEPPSWKFTFGNLSTMKMFNVKDEKQFISLGPWDISPKYQPDGQLSSEKVKKMIDQAMREGTNFFEWTHRQCGGEDFPTTVLFTKVATENNSWLQATVRDISKQKQTENNLKMQTLQLDVALKEALKSREVLSSMLDDNNQIREKMDQNIVELRAAHSLLKETQNQLIQAEKLSAVGRLASCVAHEVKNPLAIIMQSAEYLTNKVPPEHKEIIQMITTNIKRADTIVRTLVDFSRKSELKVIPEDINFILESSLVLVQHNIRQESIKIIKEFKESLPKVLVDKNKIEQVFVNILINAIQAMPNGGNIFIRTYTAEFEKPKEGIGRRAEDFFKLREKVVVVEIEDTGVGIKEENLDKIFEPFFTTKEPGAGTGLGLAVTGNIIAMHKGLIEIKSKVDEGTNVIVILKTERASYEQEKGIDS